MGHAGERTEDQENVRPDRPLNCALTPAKSLAQLEENASPRTCRFAAQSPVLSNHRPMLLPGLVGTRRRASTASLPPARPAHISTLHVTAGLRFSFTACWETP